VLVFIYCLLVERSIGPGDPPGPQFAYAAFVLPVVVASGLVILPAAALGAIKAARGLRGSLRTPGRPARGLCIVGLVLHTSPLLLIFLGLGTTLPLALLAGGSLIGWIIWRIRRGKSQSKEGENGTGAK